MRTKIIIRSPWFSCSSINGLVLGGGSSFVACLYKPKWSDIVDHYICNAYPRHHVITALVGVLFHYLLHGLRGPWPRYTRPHKRRGSSASKGRT